jgi:hypothetical protein
MAVVLRHADRKTINTQVPSVGRRFRPIRVQSWGRPPGLRGSPWTRCSITQSASFKIQRADVGVGCGPGGPPHQACKLSGFPKTGDCAVIVGQTPRSARVPLDPLFASGISFLQNPASRRGRRLRTRGSAPPSMQTEWFSGKLSGAGASACVWEILRNPRELSATPQ